jgi:hypothetical protein
VAFVRLAFFPGGTADQFAALADAVGEIPEAAERILFAAGPVPGGWQVVQVWRSQADLDAFNRAVFLPARERVGAAGLPVQPQVIDFETVLCSVPAG